MAPTGRRYRSLSRGRFPPATPEPGDHSTPRGRFVNKQRGSGFPEISLDDEFFWDESGRRRSRGSGGDVSSRGRSVSKATPEAERRRRRSVSVARYRDGDGDCENDLDLSRSSGPQNKLSSCNVNIQQKAVHTPNTSDRVLRKSMSQMDLYQAHDSYSSHSSSVTDDEAWEVHTNISGTEKTIQMEHPEDGEGAGFYEAMRKEVRNVVGEIRTELEKVMVKPVPATMANEECIHPKSSNVSEAIADIRNCTTKLEQSEKRKQELLAELAVEEKRGQELSKIVRELLPEPQLNTTMERSSRSRRGSNDRTLMSKALDEEAERYFEDFLSNVEDTDVSSFDGERSDTNSAVGVNSRRHYGVLNIVSETRANHIKADYAPVETDGVTFPWLQWEASTDISPSPCKYKMRVPMELGSNMFTAPQKASTVGEQSDDWKASFRSLNLEGSGSSSSILKDLAVCRRDTGRYQNSISVGEHEGSSFDMDEYMLLQQNEDLLGESLRQRHRIESGSLVVCRRSLM